MKFFDCRRFAGVLLLFAITCGGCTGNSEKPQKKPVTSIQQLNDPAYTVTVSELGAYLEAVKRDLPKAKRIYLSGQPAYDAVRIGKADAYAFDRMQMEVAIAEGLKGVRILPGSIGEPTKIAVGLSRASKFPGLKDKINQFIAELKANGTLQDMYRRWTTGNRTMPDIPVPEKAGTKIVVGTTGLIMPFSYYEGTTLTGYDVELSRRFANWLGAELEFKVYNFEGAVTAAAAGDVDCVMSNLNITPERAEKMDFSDVLFTEDAAVMVKDDASAAEREASEEKGYYSIAELDGKRIGVLTGSIGGEIIKGTLPTAKVLYLDTYADMTNSLNTGKIDAILEDDFVVFELEHENPNFKHIDGYLRTFDKAFIFTKSPEGDKIRNEFNEFVGSLKADGTLKKISDVWLGFDENAKTLPDYEKYPDTNGTIKFAVDNMTPAFSYVKDGKIVGYDVDVLTRFCKAYGYRPEPSAMNFSGELSAVSSGKCLVGISAIAVTPERAEVVNFSEPVYTGGAVLLVKKSPEELKASEKNAASVAQDSGTPEKYTKLADLNGKKIGVQTGVDALARLAKRLFPDSEVLFFNDITSLVAALESGKIDAFLENNVALSMLMPVNKNITVLNENVYNSYSGAVALRRDEKGQKLKAQWDEYITALKKDGKIDAIMNKWTGADESAKTLPDYKSFPAPNGVLVMATDGDYPPLSYYSGNTLKGFEIDLAAGFCEAYGYGLKSQVMSYSGLMPSLAVGKCDFSVVAASVSEEHKETVTFSVPYYTFTTKIAVLASSKGTPAPAQNTDTVQDPRFAALNGQKIGVQTGVDEWADIVHRLLPDSEVAYYNYFSDMSIAMLGGKIAAFVCDVPVLDMLMHENKNIASLGVFLGESFDIAAAFSKSNKAQTLKAQFDEFITALKNTGELDSIISKWTNLANPDKSIPDYQALPAPNGVLNMAVDGANPPFSYYIGNQLAGFEIELAVKFCEAYGYGLNMRVMTFDAVLSALLSGKCDFSLADLTPSPEHEENMLFSVPYYACATTLAVPANSPLAAKTPAPEPAANDSQKAAQIQAQNTDSKKKLRLAELNGKRIGVQTGVEEWADIVRELLPDSPIIYYNTFADLVAALKGRKIDAFPCDSPVLDIIISQNKGIAVFGERLEDSFDVGVALPMSDRGEKLKAQWDEYISSLKNDGRLDALVKKWTGPDENAKIILDYASLPSPNGVVRMATNGEDSPFNYYKNNKLVGLEVDLAAGFAEKYGYGLDVRAMDYDAIFAAVQSGKCDFGMELLTPKDEHTEKMLFSVPYYACAVGIAVRAENISPKTVSAPQQTIQTPSVITQSLAGKKVGVIVGTTGELTAKKFISEAELVYFDNRADVLTALKLKKIDAVCMGYNSARFVMLENEDLAFLGEPLTRIDSAAIFSKTAAGRKLCAQFTEFINARRADGTLQEWDSLWFGHDENKRTAADYSSLPAANGILKLAVNTVAAPFAYVKDNKILGYDIECAVKFCEAYGYGLEIMPMSFAAIIPAVLSGKCDFGLCNISVTEERKESVLFSAPNMSDGDTIVVRKADAQTANNGFGSLAGKRIAVTTGTTHGDIALRYVPDANLVYFDSEPDTFTALKARKADAVCAALETAQTVMAEDDSFAFFGEQLTHVETAPIFPKTEAGRKLCGQFSEFIKALWDDGTIQKVRDVWLGGNKTIKTIKDYSKFPAHNGTLKLAVDAGFAPYIYVKDNKIVGYDVDLVVRFCEAYGYGLEIVPMNFAGIIPAVQSGKCDFGTSCLTITEERKESVLFSYPFMKTGNVFVVRKAENQSQPVKVSGTSSIRLQDLSGKKVGIILGANHDTFVAEKIPDAKIEYFSDLSTITLALRNGKIAAFANTLPTAIYMTNAQKDLAYISEPLESTNTYSSFTNSDRGRKLCGEYEEFLRTLWDDGTIKRLADKWVYSEDESSRTIEDYSKLPAVNGILKMAIDTGRMPFAYVKDNRITGYDIELASMFCKAKGYGLEVYPLDFAGILGSIKTGKCDLTGSITWTEERAETMLYSSVPNAQTDIVLLVMNTQPPAPKPAPESASGLYTNIQDLAGKRIAVQTGTITDQIIASFVPTAKPVYFDTQSDLVTALRTDKVDAICSDIPIARFMVSEYDNMAMLGDPLTHDECAPLFAKTEKGRKLCAQFTEFAKACWENGTIQKLESIWFGRDDSKRAVKDYTKLPAPNGNLKMAVDTSIVPFAYVKNNMIAGYDVDFAVRFCEAYGYGLEIVPMNFAGLIPAVMSGKCDAAISCITITPERAESVLFSEPNLKSGVGVFVRKSDTQPQAPHTLGRYNSIQELAGKKVGVQTGTTNERLVAENIPTATRVYFNTLPDALLALKTRKIDAICCSIYAARYMMIENDDIMYLDHKLASLDLMPIFSPTEKGRKLREEYSEFVKGLWADGTIKEIDSIWLGKDDSRRVLKDYSKLPAPNGILKMASEPTDIPFVYMKDNQFVGYDVDIAVRFCEAHGYGLEVVPMAFSSVVSSINSGKTDFSASMHWNKERAESALFASVPTAHSGNVIVVMKAKPESSAGEYSAFEELAGKNIGAQTGTPNGDFALKAIPTANIQYFDDFADIVTALKMRKIDAAALALNAARFMLIYNENLTAMGKPLAELDAAPIFAKTDKGKKLCEQFNTFIKAQWDNGTLQELDSIWFGRDESKRTAKDYASLPAPNGVLKMGVDTSLAPFAYVKDNQIVGYEIDCAVKFCQEYGYGLEVVPMNFGALIAAVQSGKCDFASCTIAITSERAEQVLFAAPNAKTGSILVVRKAQPKTQALQPKAGTPSSPSQASPQIQPSPAQTSQFMEDARVFLEELKASFNRTFIREERWRLFIEGIINTMIITVLSIIFGTILGFVVYLFCRGGNVVANLITRFFIWLIEGTPMVVLLMILYYIIFGKVDISGIWVAVIAFTMTFGAGFYGMLKSGTGALDRGQTEAAYALGFSDTQTFFTVILPQAALHFMPAYKSSVVALIKATAIVGYIAVQDLTKMGDIVRSRTYEAFFPLIAVAAIYFVLAGLLNIIVGIIHNRIRPEKRTKADILKGVDTHD